MQPPAKKRKVGSAVVGEIVFDTAARQEYLTGFHKRKLQRAKHAQEAAEKKARLERIEERRKLREERKADLERHVQEVNALLRPLPGVEGGEESQSETGLKETDSWSGVSEPPEVDREADYVDEGRYTTVTIEAMDVSRGGLHKVGGDQQNQVTGDKESQVGNGRVTEEGRNLDEKPRWTREKPKDRLDRPKKKRKFCYESKGDRKVARVKEKVRKGRQASARRAG